jgi:hypothetical protein
MTGALNGETGVCWNAERRLTGAEVRLSGAQDDDKRDTGDGLET